MKTENDETLPFRLQIQLFGAFDVRINDVPIPPLRSRKVQWLLALLILRHNQALDRVWLAGTLWPDSAPSQALYNLRQSLSNIRQALGAAGQCLHASMVNALTLDLTHADVDIITFDAAITEGDRASLERAAALYRGPLLEGCAEEWVFSERRVREERFLNALEKLANDAVARGEGGAAVSYLQTVVQADPLRERTQRALIQALAHVGDYGAAVQAYRDLRLLLRRELNADPDPETVSLFQHLQQESRRLMAAPPVPSEAPRRTVLRQLPSPLTPLVGRTSEVEQIVAHLRTVRLLTLIGPGGVGKTRLAISVAEILAEECPDGVFFVNLAPLSDPALIVRTIATVLQVREEPNRSLLQTLQERLESKTLLLLLDNCEHLLDPCATIVDALLNHCSGIRILATSRQALGLTGEVGWTVPPLTTPSLTNLAHTSRQAQKEWLSLLSEYEAVQLFVVRAQQALPTFRMSAQNAKAVAQICLHLDGIPFALELAAARVRFLAVEDINHRLDDRFRLLTGGSRTALPRQQTLRALMDWSYDLLTEEEKALLRRLSVFAGGWTLQAAEEVCAEGNLGTEAFQDAGYILDTLTRLIEKSLVVYEAQTGGSRYRLLETMREYARDRLREREETDAGRVAHRDYFLRLAEEAQEKLKGPEQAEWLERLETEHDNLRAALDFCLNAPSGAKTGLQLAGALQQFWWTHGHLSEGRERLAAALNRPEVQDPTQERGIALNGAGSLAWMQGDYDAARSFYEASLELGRKLEDKPVIASALGNLGNVANRQGEYAVARSHFEESLTIRRELGDKRGMAHALVGLGNMAMEQGDYAAARSFSEASLAIARELEDKRGVARALTNLGNVAMEQGDYAAATACYESSLAIQSDLGDKRGIARSLNNLGNVINLQADYATARSRFEEGLTIQRELGDKEGTALTLCNLGPLLAKQGEYSAAQNCLQECLTICQALGEKWVMAYALEGYADLAFRQRQMERSARLYGAADALRTNIGSLLSPNARREYEPTVAAVRAALGDEAFLVVWAEGQTMTLSQAIA